MVALTECFDRALDAAGPEVRELLAGELERSVPWLAAEEGRITDTHRYVVVNRAGAATAFAACYLIRHDAAHRAYATWDVLLGAATAPLVDALPDGPEKSAASSSLAALCDRLPVAATDTLAVAAPGSVTTGVAYDPRLTAEARREDLHALVNAVEESAAELQVPIVEFAYVPVASTHQDLGHVLRQRGYAEVVVGADAILDVRWSSLDDYFATFSSRRRWDFRRNRQRFLAHDPVVRVQGPDGLAPDLIDLQLEQYLRHGHAADAADVRDRFTRAARVPGLKVLRADAGGRPLGFVAFYESLGARRIVTRLGGFVYGRPECYFNISYYELIAHAARSGRMRIHYGDTTYAAKVARGCQLSRLTTYLRASDPVLQEVLADAGRLRTTLERRQLAAATGSRPVPDGGR